MRCGHIYILRTGYDGVVEHGQTVSFTHINDAHLLRSTVLQQQRSPSFQLLLSRLRIRLDPARTDKAKLVSKQLPNDVRLPFSYVKNGGKLYCHGHWTSPMSVSRVRRHVVNRDSEAETTRTEYVLVQNRFENIPYQFCDINVRYRDSGSPVAVDHHDRTTKQWFSDCEAKGKYSRACLDFIFPEDFNNFHLTGEYTSVILSATAITYK